MTSPELLEKKKKLEAIASSVGKTTKKVFMGYFKDHPEDGDKLANITRKYPTWRDGMDSDEFASEAVLVIDKMIVWYEQEQT